VRQTLDEISYKILEFLDKEPTHFLALKRKFGLNDQKTSMILKDLRDRGLVTRTIPDAPTGKKNPYGITPEGISVLRDHLALERYKGALENLNKRFEALWTPAARREADGMHALFTCLIVDIIDMLFEAGKAKSLSEAEQYVNAELAGRLSDIILDYARICHTRKDLDLGGLPLLGYVHDSFLSYRDRELSDWIQKYGVDWTEYVGLVPDVELVHALMASETASIGAERLLKRAAYAKHGDIEVVDVERVDKGKERRRMMLTNKALASKLKRHAPLTGKTLVIVGSDKRKGKYSDFYVEEEEQAKRDGVV